MADTLDRRAPVTRPISPHLQIYRLPLTLVMSGLHRITGFVLYFGMLLVCWWFLAAAQGPNAYAKFQWFAGSIIGQIVILGYTWSLIHHTLGGIRHLIWDTGRGFGPQEREWLAAATIIGSLALTFVVALIGYLAMGGSR